MKKRIEWIDIVKFICIMFVMLSHLECNTRILFVFYYPFYLTLFFFSSGYVYNDVKDFRTFFSKKVKGLLVPWLILSCFNIFLSGIMSFREQVDIKNELMWNFLQIRGIYDGLWFVAALFVAFIPFYFLVKIGRQKYKLVILVSFILSVISSIYVMYMNPQIFPWKSNALPWHLEYIFQAMFFMILGYYYKVYGEEKIDKYNTKKNRVIVWAIYLMVVYTPYVFNIDYQGVAEIIHTYISQMLGVIAIITFSKTIKSNKYINYVGQNTLLYFAFHGKVFRVLQVGVNKIAGEAYSFILENDIVSSVYAIVFTILLSIILVIPSYIVNRYFPFVLGKGYPKKQ